MGVGHGSSDKLVMYERGSLDNVNNSSVACVNSPGEREREREQGKLELIFS